MLASLLNNQALLRAVTPPPPPVSEVTLVEGTTVLAFVLGYAGAAVELVTTEEP